MARESINDLASFVAVARHGSFTKAAAELGITQSALSHAMRALEARMGVALLSRSTRKVTPTDAGDRLFRMLAPRFERIDTGLAATREMRDQPVGLVRISAAEHAAKMVLYPRLQRLLEKHPELQVEITIDYTLADIVAQRFDAGVRLGDQVAKDMIAVRISPDFRIAVVGSPSYLAHMGVPRTPHDLASHNCIGRRLATHGGIYAWEFDRQGEELSVKVAGQWTFNSSTPALQAALDGAGLAYLPEDMVLDHLRSGALVSVLDDWCSPFTGYHLYYANRMRSSRTLGLVVEALRCNSGGFIAAQS